MILVFFQRIHLLLKLDSVGRLAETPVLVGSRRICVNDGVRLLRLSFGLRFGCGGFRRRLRVLGIVPFLDCLDGLGVFALRHELLDALLGKIEVFVRAFLHKAPARDGSIRALDDAPAAVKERFQRNAETLLERRDCVVALCEAALIACLVCLALGFSKLVLTRRRVMDGSLLCLVEFAVLPVEYLNRLLASPYCFIRLILSFDKITNRRKVF